MYKAPLHIYTIWHPKFKNGKKFADDIHTYFNRNVNEPLSRGIGIPVFYRSSFHDRKINFDLAEKNAIVVFIDDFAVINWKDFVKDLKDQIDASGEKARLYPVSITDNFPNIGNSISEVNFIRLHDKSRYSQQANHLLGQLTHEFCRILYSKPRISDISKVKLSDDPIRLFISHAKKDGETIAKAIKSNADANRSLQTFFDTIDIAPGYRFKTELDGAIESTALLAIQTDSYSSREWCRWEVLRAKKNGRPVVVINAVEKGEERSFPYLGNVPTIRWTNSSKSEKHLEKILDFTLNEVLRFIYTHNFLHSLPGLTKLTGSKKPSILASPPELLTLLEKASEAEKKGKIVIYPDPPLTAEELELLQETTDDFDFVTPTTIPAYATLNSKNE